MMNNEDFIKLQRSIFLLVWDEWNFGERRSHKEQKDCTLHKLKILGFFSSFRLAILREFSTVKLSHPPTTAFCVTNKISKALCSKTKLLAQFKIPSRLLKLASFYSFDLNFTFSSSFVSLHRPGLFPPRKQIEHRSLVCGSSVWCWATVESSLSFSPATTLLIFWPSIDEEIREDK